MKKSKEYRLTLNSTDYRNSFRRMGELQMPITCPGLKDEDLTCRPDQLQIALVNLTEAQIETLKKEDEFFALEEIPDEVVHYSHWASHGDIQVVCDEPNGRISSRAGWVQHAGLPPDVYNRDDGRLYTFEREKATCPECAVNPADTKE